jgi:hypothetical protein
VQVVEHKTAVWELPFFIWKSILNRLITISLRKETSQ